MKKIKNILFILLMFAITFFTMPFERVHAGIPPHNNAFVTIEGIEGEYVAAFASSGEFTYANDDYESWLDQDEATRTPYHPIMEYKDNEGYRWIGEYFECDGKEEISLRIYFEGDFKVIIYKDNQLYKVSEKIEFYAYDSYYKIDLSSNDMVVKKSYNYFGNILFLIFRIVLILSVEIGLLFLLKMYTKRNFIVTLILNVIGQLFLNIYVFISLYFNGTSSGIFTLLLVGLQVFIVQFIAYQFLLKKKHRLLIILYPILASVISLFIIRFTI
jgi:hypothetical protein